RRLEAPAGVWLGGLDGLSLISHGLIAVQIGVRPERVIRLRLDSGDRRIDSPQILEINRPECEGPIQGHVNGRAVSSVANSQLDLGNPETGAFVEERGKATVVLRLPL